MIRVMEVILNRVASDEFPDTVQGVVYQKSQFESVTNGSIYRAEITPEVRQALAEVEKNFEANDSIVAFETTSNKNTLGRYFDYSFTEGQHDFYTTKKN
jgi:N-acetylmuramoyl-L-alanine amidase